MPKTFDAVSATVSLGMIDVGPRELDEVMGEFLKVLLSTTFMCIVSWHPNHSITRRRRGIGKLPTQLYYLSFIAEG